MLCTSLHSNCKRKAPAEMPSTIYLLLLICVISIYLKNGQVLSDTIEAFATEVPEVWNKSSAPITQSWFCIDSDYSGQYQVAAVETGGGIYTSTNYGRSWTRRVLLDADVQISNVVSDYSGKYLVATQLPGQIYISENYGLNWTESSAPYKPWNDIDSSSTGEFLVACADSFNDTASAVYRSADYGKTWSLTSAPGGASYIFVASDATGAYLVAVKFTAGIYTSSNYGVNWIPSSAPPLIWAGIVSDATGMYLAAACSAGIYTSNSTGRQWYLSSATSNVDYSGMSSDSSGRYIYATIYNGGILSSSDYGSTWVVSSPSRENWRGIASSGTGKRLSAITSNNGIWTYTDSSSFYPTAQPSVFPTARPTTEDNRTTTAPTATPGTPWVRSYAPVKQWKSVASDLTGKNLAAVETTAGGIYTSTNFGRNWTLQMTIANAQWSRITCDAQGQHLAATQNGGGIYISSNYGDTWVKSKAPTEAYVGVVSDYSGQHMASFVNNNGGVHTSRDYGMHWNLTDSPTRQWSDLASDSTGQYLVGVVFGGTVYTSNDYGVSWIQTNAPPLTWYGVACDASGRYVVAVVINGGIYTSQDYGMNWIKTSAPVDSWDSVASDATGSYLVAVMNEGEIYMSDDFGVTWTLSNAPTKYWESVASDGGGKRLVAVGLNDAGIWTYEDLTTFKPSAAPTMAPTRPTAIPTMLPTRTPSADPTIQPSLAPRPNPTARPSTQVPSAEPTTADPSAYPTEAPSPIPTEAPTAEPSAEPTLHPTALPTTASPSVDPTYRPTRQPTFFPTPTSTQSPTFYPTMPMIIQLTFTSNITLEGVAKDVLDTSSKNAIVSATAQSMGVPTTTVIYAGTVVVGTAVSSRSKQEQKVSVGEYRALTSQADSSAPSTSPLTYTLLAITRTTVLLADTEYDSTDELYAGLTSALYTAVHNGEFSADMHSQVSASSPLYAAMAYEVDSSPAVVTTEPETTATTESSSLTTAALAGMVVGIILGSFIGASIVYWCCVERHRGATRENQRTINVAEGNLIKKPSFRKRFFKTLSSGSGKMGAFQSLSGTEGKENETGEVEMNPLSAHAGGGSTKSKKSRSPLKKKNSQEGFFGYEVWDLDGSDQEQEEAGRLAV